MARPRKQVQKGEDDDQPTYVVEDSQDTLSKDEYEALVAADNTDKEAENNLPSSPKAGPSIQETEAKTDEATRETALVKQQVAGIGGSTKRRLAKVVGHEEEEDEAVSEESHSGQNSKKPRARKGKKVKLSFDEEGTEP